MKKLSGRSLAVCAALLLAVSIGCGGGGGGGGAPACRQTNDQVSNQTGSVQQIGSLSPGECIEISGTITSTRGDGDAFGGPLLNGPQTVTYTLTHGPEVDPALLGTDDDPNSGSALCSSSASPDVCTFTQLRTSSTLVSLVVATRGSGAYTLEIRSAAP